MENGPLKMHFLLKFGIFHCYVRFPECSWKITIFDRGYNFIHGWNFPVPSTSSSPQHASEIWHPKLHQKKSGHFFIFKQNKDPKFIPLNITSDTEMKWTFYFFLHYLFIYVYIFIYIYIYMGVSKNTGTPKWMVYNGKPY